MSIYRKWYCACSGMPLELAPETPPAEDEPGEPTCPKCGASPSDDPKRTVIYRDIEDWED
jgi:hypothetical protein